MTELLAYVEHHPGVDAGLPRRDQLDVARMLRAFWECAEMSRFAVSASSLLTAAVSDFAGACDVDVTITHDILAAGYRIRMEWTVAEYALMAFRDRSVVASVMEPIERILIFESRAEIEAGRTHIVLSEN